MAQAGAKRAKTLQEAALERLANAGVPGEMLRGCLAAAAELEATRPARNAELRAEAERKRGERWRGRFLEVAGQMERIAVSVAHGFDNLPAEGGLPEPSPEELKAARAWVNAIRLAADVVRRLAPLASSYDPMRGPFRRIEVAVLLADTVRGLTGRPHLRDVAELLDIDAHALETTISRKKTHR